MDLEEIDPLASEDVLLDELTMVLTLARFRYPNSAETMGRIVVQAMSETDGNIKGRNAKCAIILYLIGALVGGPHQQRESSNAAGQLDEINTELAAMAFRVVLNENRPRGFGLEMAILYFLQCFQYHLIESRTRAQVWFSLGVLLLPPQTNAV